MLVYLIYQRSDLAVQQAVLRYPNMEVIAYISVGKDINDRLFHICAADTSYSLYYLLCRIIANARLIFIGFSHELFPAETPTECFLYVLSCDFVRNLSVLLKILGFKDVLHEILGSNVGIIPYIHCKIGRQVKVDRVEILFG